MAERLTHIVDSELPAQEHVETDNGGFVYLHITWYVNEPPFYINACFLDSDVIHRFVDLLKEYGDQMNEKVNTFAK